jgi:hypothetical protein
MFSKSGGENGPSSSPVSSSDSASSDHYSFQDLAQDNRHLHIQQRNLVDGHESVGVFHGIANHPSIYSNLSMEGAGYTDHLMELQ